MGVATDIAKVELVRLKDEFEGAQDLLNRLGMTGESTTEAQIKLNTAKGRLNNFLNAFDVDPIS